MNIQSKMFLKWGSSVLLVCIIFFIFSGKVFAGVTGKIAGKITDAESGEPLPGVNVIVEGTNMGAASDVNGNYFIINVPPSTYDVRALMMGYKTITKTGVRVSIDRFSTVSKFPVRKQMNGVTFAGRDGEPAMHDIWKLVAWFHPMFKCITHATQGSQN